MTHGVVYSKNSHKSIMLSHRNNFVFVRDLCFYGDGKRFWKILKQHQTYKIIYWWQYICIKFYPYFYFNIYKTDSTTKSFLNSNLNSKRNTTEILFIWEYYIYPISNSVLIPLKLLQRRHEQNLLTFIYFRLCTWMFA